MLNETPEVLETCPKVGDQKSAPTLSVQNLCVTYGRGRTQHNAAVGVSFDVHQSESFGIVGESGSGKTTVALSVLQYLPRSASLKTERLLFQGQDLRDMRARELRALRGNRLSAVYQNPGSALNPVLTIGRQVSEILTTHRDISTSAANERVVELLGRMRLQDPERLLDLYPHELSGGMQQRVTIAMAVALEPALIVLDEPTTALDASVRGEVVSILRELRETAGTSLLVISHDIDLISRLTDRVAVMQAGHIVETGKTSNVLATPSHTYTKTLIASHDSHGERRPPSQSGAEAPVALKASRITKTIAGHPILGGLDVTLRRGETLGLVGESGSGKSTLARILAGLDRPTSGEIEIQGELVAGLVENRAPAARNRLQMVFQSPDTTLNPRHKIKRILSGSVLDGLGRQGEELRREVSLLLEAVRLPLDVLERYPRELSGGQRQRVAIARAFARKPNIVILDEPTSALDVSVQASVLKLLDDLQRLHGSAYLFISHDLNVVRSMADTIAVLHRGVVVEAGSAEEVFSNPQHAYTRRLFQAMLSD